MTLLQKMSKKQRVLAVIVLLTLLFWVILTGIAAAMKAALADQQAAQRWANEGGFAQVSCFFADNALISADQVRQFRANIESGLREASYTAENAGARSFIDAYSASGQVRIASDRAAIDAKAVGVGGDFFRFHPLELVYGTYFSGSDLMKDGIVIDEEAAWQLFGSSDVAGMTVTIGGVNHIVKGVVARQTGRLWEGAGLVGSVAYLSQESLAAYGDTPGISCYEVVMPNPVSGFAYRLVLEKFGFSGEQMLVVDNSARYGIGPLYRVLTEVGLRSMQSAGIRFPFWENYARGYEDILAFILVWQALFLLIPGAIIIVSAIYAYQHRPFKWRDVPVKAWELGKKIGWFTIKKLPRKRKE